MTDISRNTKTTGGIAGGFHLSWLLGDDPRTVTTKNGDTRTVVELRDPARLSSSLVLWLDADGEQFQGVPPNTPISLHVKSVRSGRGRGELLGDADPTAVAAAFAAARGERS